MCMERIYVDPQVHATNPTDDRYLEIKIVFYCSFLNNFEIIIVDFIIISSVIVDEKYNVI